MNVKKANQKHMLRKEVRENTQKIYDKLLDLSIFKLQCYDELSEEEIEEVISNELIRIHKDGEYPL